MICNYKGNGKRNINDAACAWHKHGGFGQKPDPFCKNCTKGGLLMFDLKLLGQLVAQHGIPDKTIFTMSKEEIQLLGKCFMEAQYASQTQNYEDDLPF